MLKAKDPKATVAFVYEDASFSVAVVNPAKAYAQQLGFNVVFSEAYAPNTTDFSAIIDKVIASKPNVLIGGGHYPDGSTLARQLYSHKVNLKMITLLVAPDSPQWSELGDAAVGVVVPSQWEPQTAFKAQYGPSGADFAKAYTAKYNVPPSYESAGGYACGLILQHAIEQAGGLTRQKCWGVKRYRPHHVLWTDEICHEANDHGLQIGHSMVLAQWQKDKSGSPGEAGSLAAGCQERQFGISDPLGWTTQTQEDCAAAFHFRERLRQGEICLEFSLP